MKATMEQASIDTLFEQPFEPLWMKWQRESFGMVCQTQANYAWRVMANETNSRIARKWANRDSQGRLKAKPQTS